MKALSEFTKESLGKIRFLLTDIDDTLTENGRLPAKSYQALEKLQKEGLKVIPITGRTAGWCDHIARMWPVDGVVGENGAFYFFYNHAKEKIFKRYWKSENERASDRERLKKLQIDILEKVKGCAVSSDQAFRESDLAIDFCEDVKELTQDAIDQIVLIFEKAGATAKKSSIHVNGWFGDYDKLSMTKTFLAECFKTEIDFAQDQIIFCGDSPNDEPMFDYFENSVGVANVLDYADNLEKLPRWITKNRTASGFFELSEAILSTRISS